MVCMCAYVWLCVYRIMEECRAEWGGGEVMSSDEDMSTNQISDEAEVLPISEEDYHRMLRLHHKKRIRKKVCRTSVVLCGVGSRG